MKTKTKSNDDRDLQHFPVNYQWSGPDGAVCHSHTVAAGRSHSDAERRFFKQNHHVSPEQPEAFQDTTDYAHD